MNPTIASEQSAAPSRNGVLLLALLVLEAAIFYIHVARDVAPFYPPMHDQLTFFLSTYDLIAALQSQGARAFLNELFQPTNPTGTTLAAQGALLALIGGANRTTILSVNLLHFFALQIVLFYAIRAISNAAFAWTGIALLLAASATFQTAGGIYDFRIDFSVLCLYGISCSLIVWSGVFRDTQKTCCIAVVAILLIYSRYFTIIFIASVFGGLLALNLYDFWRVSINETRTFARHRARNIVMCGLLVAGASLPRLYMSRDAIYGYYVVGHVLNNEKFIRTDELGIHGILAHLLYYPMSILRSHVGAWTFIIAGLLAGWSCWTERMSMREAAQKLARYNNEFIALGLAIFIPISILTINISKSPVVGSVATVPAILMIVVVGIALWPHGTVMRLGLSKLVNIARFAVVAGIAIFCARGLSNQSMPSHADLERIAAINTAIAHYAADNKQDHIALSVDRVVDYVNNSSVRLQSIEKLHRNVQVVGMFGHGSYGIFATGRADAMHLFAESDVIVLTDPAIDRSHAYPANTAIKAYWNELAQWTLAHRNLLMTTEILGVPYRVYVRPVAGN